MFNSQQLAQIEALETSSKMKKPFRITRNGAFSAEAKVTA